MKQIHLDFKREVFTLCLFLLAVMNYACSGGSSSGDDNTKTDDTPSLVISQTVFNIGPTDTKVTLSVAASASYYVKSKNNWVTPVVSTSTNLTSFILTVAENTGYMERTDTVTVTMGTKKQNVYITQRMKSFTATAADQTGVSSTAMALTRNISVGWNLGNTCESNNGNYFTTSFSGTETLWGNPTTTQEMISAVKSAGFNAIRIPVCWGAHLLDKTNWTIDATWMARVKTIVDYAYSQGLYVILNSHHDGWLEFDCNAKDSSTVRKKEVAMWTQIALQFRDYDEHLIFSGMNEPHQDNDWNAPSAEHATVESYYEQQFVNAVRATGGKNAYRCLIVQPWCCNPGYMSYFTKPTDKVANRLILEFHYYNPWNFCGTDDNTCVRFWGDDYSKYGTISTYGTATQIVADFKALKSNYIDKAIPVIMGEFGVNRHAFTATEITSGLQAHGEESRCYYLKWLVSTAHSYGIPLFYWDNGAIGTSVTATVLGSGSNAFALFNRKSSMAVYDSPAIAAIMEGAKTVYPN